MIRNKLKPLCYNGITPSKNHEQSPNNVQIALDASDAQMKTPSNHPLKQQSLKIARVETIQTQSESQTELRTGTKNSLGWMGKLLECLSCCNRNEDKAPVQFKMSTNKNLRQFLIENRNKKVTALLQGQIVNRKTLVLDLDETLVHSSYELDKWDFQTKFINDGKEQIAYTKKRHGLDKFLEVMSQFYQLIVFTAGIPDLACKIVDKIDPNSLIKHRIYRQHCIEVQYANKIYLKNLNILNRNLSQVVLLDNSKNSGLLNPQNLLLISNFYTDDEDRELTKLIPFLIYLSGLKDVRVVEQKRKEYYYGKDPKYREVFPKRIQSVKMQFKLGVSQ